MNVHDCCNHLACFMAGSAVSLRLREVVDVDVLGVVAGDDLVPLDRLDVAEVVVVQDSHRPVQDI
jgi:hypothetical protein